MSDNDVVITGCGAVSAAGFGLDAHWQRLGQEGRPLPRAARTLATFKAAPYLSDRRMLKAVSAADAIGLAALEGLVKDLGGRPNCYGADRVGLYVGAPPASVFDNEPYGEAMGAARGADGHCDVTAFGATCMGARPTTLLMGLPNNVLCYGAMLLEARGPNSNYTATAVSGHLALVNAARRIERGALDLAVAGGFTAHTEPVNAAAFWQQGLARDDDGAGDGLALADGATFIALERRQAAAARGARPLATFVAAALANDATGPLSADPTGAALEVAVRRALTAAGVDAAQIGLILAGAGGTMSVERMELDVLSRVFAKVRAQPALGAFPRALGHMMEAGGLLELALLPRLYAAGEIPRGAAVSTAGFGTQIDGARPYALVLVTSPWGDISCIVARKECE